MPGTQPAERDPLPWCIAIALGFLALAWHKLGVPSKIYFDEVHYVPAARKLLDLKMANPEHPPFGKEVIAAAIALFGDRPLVWRAPPALLGAFGLFAIGRLVWHASGRRFATVCAMLLVASGFAWFVQSRIAMLDMTMAAFGMAGLWLFAAALGQPVPRARLRLALAGVCFGLALAAKWSIAPILALPGLVWLVAAVRRHGVHFLGGDDDGPVPGMPLIEAAFWLGLLPLIVYWGTFIPNFHYVDRPVGPLSFVEHHRWMLELQDSVRKPHPYRTVWWQWVGNIRGIWYLYENVDGAQRGVLLIGNPLTMLAGLPALLWCLWSGVMRQRRDMLAFAALYAVSLGFWVVTSKPVQFYYHYLLPGTFLLAALALALDDLTRSAKPWVRALPWVVLAGSFAMFAWFHPILSSAPLSAGKTAYVEWMWLDTWR